jgi:predicted N-formylglutamate amidohydrolase
VLGYNFEIVEGSPDSRVILHVPHSATFIPPNVRADILLTDSQLQSELDSMTDTKTEEIARRATALSEVRPWLFINKYSRLVIDPERFPDDREVMNKVGMGAVYRKTSTGQDLRSPDFRGEQELLDTYFHPYAKAITDLVSQRLNSAGKVVILDIHSYRPEQHENAVNHGQKRPAMCIGTDSFHTSPELKNLGIQSFAPIGDVFENEPYAGTYVPLKYYGVDKFVQAMMMETRADTFVDEKLEFHAGSKTVIDCLSSLIVGAQLLK